MASSLKDIYSSTTIQFSTYSNTPAPSVTLSPSDTPSPSDPPTLVATHTNTPKPQQAVYTAKDDINCRDGPSIDTEQHWQLYPGQTVPALARWSNGWIVVGIDDPDTRTKCCWINGDSQYGTLNVPLTSLQLINYFPDRINCDLSD